MYPAEEPSIEGYYHSALEACAQASQLESEDRTTDALTEYRRSIALIEAMRQIAHTGHEIDEAYFAGVEDVEGICRVHVAKLEGELPTLTVPMQTPNNMRRKSTESLHSLARSGLTRAGSVPPRQDGFQERPRRAMRQRTDRPKTSRSPSPEKKEKKSMPLSLRGSLLQRQASSDSTATTTVNTSALAMEASRAATLAWQGKKPNGLSQPPRRNPSPTSSRAASIDLGRKRPTGPDNFSLLDAPLIDFSTPVLNASSQSVPETLYNMQSYTPISPAPTPPPHSPQSTTEQHGASPRRKPAPAQPPSRPLGRTNATINRPARRLKPPSPTHPRSNSAPDLSEPEHQQEIPPISVSISSAEVTAEQELSREEKALKDLKGVDEALAKTILNDIVVRGDEVQWDDIAGLEEAKTSLKETVIYPFLRPDLFSGLREPARGMLLFGPPGTGKTMLARAVATQAKSTFFSVSASTLVSKYLGESEKLVKALFALAKALSPSIIFVDEIDSLLSSRSGGDNENEASRRLKTEFLIQWSSLASAAAARTNETSPRVLVLAATNLPWAIDDAARRRFVLRQYIPLPERETRRVQFSHLLSRQHHTLTEEQFEELVTLTEGSDITALTKDAAMGPLRSLGEALLTTKREEIRPIGFEDFVTSLRKVRPSVSKEGLHAFEKWNDQFGSKG